MSSKTNTDIPSDLLPTLGPYVTGSTTALMALGIIGGWAGESWRSVLGIILLQFFGGVFLGILTRGWKNVAALRYTNGFFHLITTTAIVMITGGYPSPFWLVFLVGVVVPGILMDRTGVYLVLPFAAVALAVPQLSIGIDIQTAIGISMQLFILFFTGLIIQKTAVWLFKEQEKHQQAEESLRQSNDQLTLSIAQLEQHTREVRLLTEMGGMLHTSTTNEELYGIISYYMQELFPSKIGALFIYSPSRNDLESAATWGNFPAENHVRIFAPDECWALRQGQIYQQDASRSGLHCPHVKRLKSNNYLCVPLIARGEALGILHVQFSMDESTAVLTTPTRTIDAVLSLAASVAEYVALALANQTLRETLRNQAIRDPLTGLFNRRYAEETLDREVQRATRKQTPLSVISLDIDHFKLFNDTYGHDAGDVVLQNVGMLLKTLCRGEDVACRYGGEEFLLIMSDISLEIAQQRAETLREEMKSLRIVYKGQPLGITSSFGVAAFPKTATNKEKLLHAADAALYQAKTSGRDCVVTADQIEGGESQATKA